jgi:hypothetical protein
LRELEDGRESGRGFVVRLQLASVETYNEGVLYLKEQYSFRQNELQALAAAISV